MKTDACWPSWRLKSTEKTTDVSCRVGTVCKADRRHTALCRCRSENHTFNCAIFRYLKKCMCCNTAPGRTGKDQSQWSCRDKAEKRSEGYIIISCYAWFVFARHDRELSWPEIHWGQWLLRWTAGKRQSTAWQRYNFWILRERLFYRLRRWYNVNLTTKKIFRSSGRMW